MRKQIIISLCILLFLGIATSIVAIYGRGYRFHMSSGKPQISGTGLLVTTSIPDGAQVFINGNLQTATDNTINLVPGVYKIRIFKEGYFPWEKTITLKREVVAKAQALLFPTAPKLESITATGVENPVLDPSQTQIAYTVASQSAQKNGIYVLDMNARPLLTLRSSTLITDDTIDRFSQSKVAWSPDGQELVATVSSEIQTTYLLKGNIFNQTPQDVTSTLPAIWAGWEKDVNEKEKSRLASLKPKLRQLIVNNFKILSWSPDDTKILYQASSSATLPTVIVPPLIDTNTTAEERNIKKDFIYVYDIKEDKNFSLPIFISPSLPIRFFPNSTHLLYVHDKKIDILEYDGSNMTTLYAGPFLDNYVYPWPNGSKIVILTNLNNQNIPPNLYTISLK